MSVFPIVALRFTSPQRKALKRESSLLIENPASEIKAQVEEIVSKANGNPANALATLLHVSTKHILTFTEFEYEVDAENKIMKTTQVETHIFLVQGPPQENSEDQEVAVKEIE